MMADSLNGGANTPPSSSDSQRGSEENGVSKPASILRKVRDKLVSYRKKGKYPEYRKERRERITIFVLIITVGGVFLQWRELNSTDRAVHRQASIAQDVEVRQLRAYILPDAVQIKTTGEKQGDQIIWHISPAWKNFGATPAIEVKIHTTYGYSKDAAFLPDKTPAQAFEEIQAQIAAGKWRLDPPIAPQARRLSRDRPFGATIMQSISEKKSRINVYSLVSYKDVFGCSRIVQACYTVELPVRNWNSSEPAEAKGGFIHYCDSNNCTDGDCHPAPPICPLEMER